MSPERARVGIFGGLFNPPHIGHLALADRAAEQLSLDLVLWVPSGVPPHKETDKGAVPPGVRFELVSAAIRSRRRFSALSFECLKPGVSYSIDTIREVQRLHPEADLFFLTGADAFATLPSWRSRDELFRLVTFAVHVRRGTRVAPIDGVRHVVVEGAGIDQSSTDLRRRIGECRSVRGETPDEALRVIEREVLYAPPCAEGIRRHIEQVETAATALAERWGLPVETMRAAARFHDAYKGQSREEALELLDSFGERLDEMERSHRALLHGRVAARRMEATSYLHAEEEHWGDAVEAVRYHTTGRGEMSPIAETLMIADRFGKDWQAIEEIPLDRAEAFRQVMRRKAEILRQKKRAPHANNLEAMRRSGLAPEAV